ncbi:MAG: FliG C-terminal domain-containing protein [Bacteriovoracaceae bacterium]
MRYWRTFQKPLIHKILAEAKEKRCEFILWQQYGSSRKVYQVELTELLKNQIKFSISKASLKKTVPLNKEKPVFFHIKEMDVIFKKEQYSSFGSSFEATPPNELQIYEKRKTQRFYYKYQDHKNITFESVTKSAQEEPEFTFSSVLVDISTSGASMVLDKKAKELVYEDLKLYLINLTDQKLPQPFKVQVKYIKRYDKAGNDDLFKIGLEFADELDTVSYKSINSVIEKKAKRIQGLDRDRFCGLDLEEQFRVLNQIEASNKQLANNIKDANDYLDRLRYMTTQMKIEFLQSVSHELLATALRLSNKELIYDLFIELTVNIRQDFLEKLEKEKPPSAINKAQDEHTAGVKQ